MKKGIVGLLASFAVSVLLLAQGPASEYALGPDSQPQAGVRRVLLWIGTFVDMKGANTIPFLIRKTEPRPLRIFMQDGRADQNSVWGSWPEANQAMASALEFSAYDYRIVWGNEGHSRAHGSSILPDSLRWLWRDYPKPITVPEPVAAPARQGGPAQSRQGGPAESNLRPAAFNIVHHDRGWEQIGDTYKSVASPAADKDGNVYFADPASSRIYRATADGRVTVFKDNTAGAKALKVGAAGRIYASQPARKRIVSYGANGDEKTVAEHVDAYDLALTAKGSIYFTDAGRKNVAVIDPNGTQKIAYGGGEIMVPSAFRRSNKIFFGHVEKLLTTF